MRKVLGAPRDYKNHEAMKTALFAMIDTQNKRYQKKERENDFIQDIDHFY